MSNAAQRLSQMAECVCYFRVWFQKDETGVCVLDKALHKLVKQIRNEYLRQDKTTFGIVDAQSVQNADTAEEKGYDAGKSVRNQAPCCCRYDGPPHAIAVTTADVTDRNRAVQMILLNLDNLSCVKKFLVDGGYSGERFANQVRGICGA